MLLQTVNGPSDVTVSYNAFDINDSPTMAIAIGAGGDNNLTISHNTFTVSAGADTAIYVDGTCNNLLVDSNTFTGPADGWLAWVNWIETSQTNQATISNNIVTNAFSPIRMEGRTNALNNVTYTGNTIVNGDITIGPGDDGTQPNTLTNLAIVRNSFTGPAYEQVFFEILSCGVDAADIDWGTLTVNCNNFDAAAGEYGIKNALTGTTLNAELNWWGDASGPSGVGPGSGGAVSNNVDYDPWLPTDFQHSPECRPVGGEVYPIDKISVLGPWIGLALILILVTIAGMLALRRRRPA